MSDPSLPPNLVIPWLAIGVGLAGLVGVPNGELTSPASADARPARVAAIDQTTLDMTAPALSTTDVPSMRTITSTPPSLPANVAEQFHAVERTAGRGEPTNFRHPMLGPSEPTTANQGPGGAPMWTSSPTPAAWAELRWCESGGNYTAVSVTGTYRGAYQLDRDTWESYGGVGDPIDASSAEQDRVAAELFANRGTEPWPYCGRYLG